MLPMPATGVCPLATTKHRAGVAIMNARSTQPWRGPLGSGLHHFAAVPLRNKIRHYECIRAPLILQNRNVTGASQTP